MMRRFGLGLTALLLLALGAACAAPTAGAQTSGEDSVTGGALLLDNPCTNKFDCGEGVGIDAHSGPSGENPSGSVSVTIMVMPEPGVIEPGPSFTLGVTCLNVQGNRATVGASGAPIGSFLISVEDNGGAGLDRFFNTSVPTTPTQCPAPPPSGSGQLVADGHFAVHDAVPFPTSKDECKRGGWGGFGFRNQGQCVAFVERGPRSAGA